jgi:hypothetical protein
MKFVFVSCVVLACLMGAFAATPLQGDSFDLIEYLEGFVSFIVYILFSVLTPRLTVLPFLRFLRFLPSLARTLNRDWEVRKTLSLADGSIELRNGFYSFEKVSESFLDGVCHENTSETDFSAIDSEFQMRVEMEGPMFGKIDVSFSEPGLPSEEAFVNLLAFQQFEPIFDGVFIFRGFHNEEDVTSMITIREKENFLWISSHRDGAIETTEFVRHVPASPRSFIQKYGFTIVMVVVMMGSRFFASKMQTQQPAAQVAQVEGAASGDAPVAEGDATGEGVPQTTEAAPEGGEASSSERVSKKHD